MKSLKERIEDCKAITAELRTKYPEIEDIKFGLENVDIDQIKELDEDCRIGIDNKVIGLVATDCFDGCTVFARTRTVKNVKPLEYEFD